LADRIDIDWIIDAVDARRRDSAEVAQLIGDGLAVADHAVRAGIEMPVRRTGETRHGKCVYASRREVGFAREYFCAARKASAKRENHEIEITHGWNDNVRSRAAQRIDERW
jgi:hypothetical protein